MSAGRAVPQSMQALQTEDCVQNYEQECALVKNDEPWVVTTVPGMGTVWAIERLCFVHKLEAQSAKESLSFLN